MDTDVTNWPAGQHPGMDPLRTGHKWEAGSWCPQLSTGEPLPTRKLDPSRSRQSTQRPQVGEATITASATGAGLAVGVSGEGGMSRGTIPGSPLARGSGRDGREDVATRLANRGQATILCQTAPGVQPLLIRLDLELMRQVQPARVHGIQPGPGTREIKSAFCNRSSLLLGQA